MRSYQQRQTWVTVETSTVIVFTRKRCVTAQAKYNVSRFFFLARLLFRQPLFRPKTLKSLFTFNCGLTCRLTITDFSRKSVSICLLFRLLEKHRVNNCETAGLRPNPSTWRIKFNDNGRRNFLETTRASPHSATTRETLFNVNFAYWCFAAKKKRHSKNSPQKCV